ALLFLDDQNGVFAIDLWALRLAAVQKVSDLVVANPSVSGAVRVQMIDRIMGLADEATEVDRYEEAERLSSISLAQSKLRQVTDPEVKRVARDHHDQVNRLRREWIDVTRAEARLSSKPDEPADNLVVGKFRCFRRNEWQTGLPYLAKSGQSRLSEAAQTELDLKDVAKDQLAAALAWDKAGDGGSIDDSRDCHIRAHYWFTKALASGLTGLDAEQARTRLESLATIVPPTHPTEKLTLPSGVLAEVHPGLIGRVFVNNRDVGVLVTYSPDRPLESKVIETILREVKIPAALLRVELSGFIVVPPQGRVELEMEGGGVQATHRLFIANSKVSEVDSRNHMSRTKLSVAGTWSLLWQLNGVDRTVRTQLASNADGDRVKPKFYYTKQLLDLYRPSPYKKGQYRKEFDLNAK
ncbi:MAG TPA: hypothetical protein PLV92_16350, partial [Pirellulaceae bacterium]|nr:hypothetical protein [Pirellulaceae bacterium]